jgi:hypothetical protein
MSLHLPLLKSQGLTNGKVRVFGIGFSWTMIRSYNGVRLLSSYLIRDSCKSVCDPLSISLFFSPRSLICVLTFRCEFQIYKGVFHRTLDSGVTTLSRVLRGEGEGSYSPLYFILFFFKFSKQTSY